MRNWLFALCLLAPSAAAALPCPKVMVVLDISGSMDRTPSNGTGTPTKLDIAKSAITKLLMAYGTRLPFGLTTYSNIGSCTTGIDVLVEPENGTAAEIAGIVNALDTVGGTNTGEAIAVVKDEPSMHDSSRPGSYILLITDGAPLCPDGTTEGGETNISFVETQITAAANDDIKTFVVGFGQLPVGAQTAMNRFAVAGLEECTDTALCGTKKYYAAETDAALNAAINKIAEQIVSEVGGLCDDSCYANACPREGDICVQAGCKSNPCAGITCAPGQYCFTDGTSPGTCMAACNSLCPDGWTCQMGTCVQDPCAFASCVMGQVCMNGACVNDACARMSCDSHFMCRNGQCLDDPCNYVTCPTGTVCQPGSGMCEGTTVGGTTGRGRGTSGGCDVNGAAPTGVAWIGLLVALGLVRRRRRRA